MNSPSAVRKTWDGCDFVEKILANIDSCFLQSRGPRGVRAELAVVASDTTRWIEDNRQARARLGYSQHPCRLTPPRSFVHTGRECKLSSPSEIPKSQAG